jgi:hypothetical protein
MSRSQPGLDTYHAACVVVDRKLTPMTADLSQSLSEIGDVVLDNGRMVVVRAHAGADAWP